MIIIQGGALSKVDWPLRFSCGLCGCVFDCEKDEAKTVGISERRSDTSVKVIHVTTICPECRNSILRTLYVERGHEECIYLDE